MFVVLSLKRRVSLVFSRVVLDKIISTAKRCARVDCCLLWDDDCSVSSISSLCGVT